MTQDDQFNEQALQELREEIKARGWKESAEYVARDIEFVGDLCAAGLLPLTEVFDFGRSTQVTLDTLEDLRGAPYPDEVHRLCEAVQALKEAFEYRRKQPSSDDGRKQCSLSAALYWRECVDDNRRFCEACCYSWRIHLNRLPADQRQPAAECVTEIEKRIPLLRSGRLADAGQQGDAIEKCLILNGQLTGYMGDISNVAKFAEAIIQKRERWAAFLEALADSKWLDSRRPRNYLERVTAIKYRQVRPDTGGQDSQGFYHRPGPGGSIKDSDALRGISLTLEEIAERPDEALVERQFTERSVSELQKAAEADPQLAMYTHAITRKPEWKRSDIWDSLGWNEKVGKAVDRKYRRLLRRLKEIGAGMEWRVAPTPGLSAGSQNTYFEPLLDGKNGARFGVIQHKILKTQDK